MLDPRPTTGHAAGAILALALVASAGCTRSRPPPPADAPLRAAVAAAKDLDLPSSRRRYSPRAEREIVVLSRRELSIDGDPYAVAAVPADPGLGFAAEDKPSKRDDVYVMPLGVAVRAFPKLPDAAREGPGQAPFVPITAKPLSRPVPRDLLGRAPRVLLAADKGTPYRMLVEIVHTIDAAGGGGTWLAARSPSGLGAIGVVVARGDGPPRIKGDRPPARAGLRSAAPSLDLVVAQRSDGFDVSARGRHVAAGCEDVGRGRSVPAKDGALDYDALTACAKRIKESSADFADETQVVFAAPEATPLEAVVRAIEALVQRSDGGELFPDVLLALPEAP